MQHQKLTDREHILKRPDMYIGGNKLTPIEGFFLEETNKFVLKKNEFNSGLLKIIFEIIDNSVDEAIRHKFKKGNKVTINTHNNFIEVIDNGTGIPSSLMKDTNEPVALVCLTHARAGSNFNDEDRKGAGMNGVGSFLTNVFSKEFKASSINDSKKFSLECYANCDPLKTKWNVKDSKASTGTTIKFLPDYEKFGLKDLDNTHLLMVKQRLILLSLTYPEITFTLNDERISIKYDEFLRDYLSIEEYEILKTDNGLIAIAPSLNDYQFLLAINGLSLTEGGTIIDFVTREVIEAYKDKLIKKYPSITPRDIKSKMFILGIFRDFNNCRFQSQTKTKQTNPISEIRDYLDNWQLDKLVKKCLKNQELLDLIEEHFKQKIAAEEQIALKKAGKLAKKKVKIDKYLAPTKKEEYLILTEGDSALAPLVPIFGRENMGYFPLKGKVKNVWESSSSEILKNEELNNILTILGVDLSKPIKDQELRYKYILLATDQDPDGILIRGLFLAFAYKHLRHLLEEKRIRFLQTPICTFVDKKKKPIKWFYSKEELNAFLKTEEAKKPIYNKLKYKKGLGSWDPSSNQLKQIINSDGFEALTLPLVLDKDAEYWLEVWHASNGHQDTKKNIIREFLS